MKSNRNLEDVCASLKIKHIGSNNSPSNSLSTALFYLLGIKRIE